MSKKIKIRYNDGSVLKCNLFGCFDSSNYDCRFVVFERLDNRNKIFGVPVVLWDNKLYFASGGTEEQAKKMVETFFEDVKKYRSINIDNNIFDNIYFDKRIFNDTVIIPKLNIGISAISCVDGKKMMVINLDEVYDKLNDLSMYNVSDIKRVLDDIIVRADKIGNYLVIDFSDVVIMKTVTKDIDVSYDLDDVVLKDDYFNYRDDKVDVSNISESEYFGVFRSVFEDIYSKICKLDVFDDYKAFSDFKGCYRKNGEFIILDDSRCPYIRTIKYIYETLVNFIKEVSANKVSVEVDMLLLYINNRMSYLSVDSYLGENGNKLVKKR